MKILELILAIGISLSVVVNVSAVTWEIPTDFLTITQAIQSPGVSAGDTLQVLSGYDSSNETFPIVVDKQITISCDPGAVIEVPASHAGITITSDGDGSTIENCEITSASPSDRGDIGIVVDRADPVTLTGNDIHGLVEGIRLIRSDGNIIDNNNVHENIGIGVHLERSDGNTFTGNDVWGNGEGLFLNEADGNGFTQDQYRDNAFIGVHLEGSGQETVPNTFDDVTVTGNGGWGFYLIDSHGNVIRSSEISGNQGGGIKLEGSDGNTIGCVSGANCGNHIRNNGDGADEDINVLLTKGTIVEFSAPVVETQLAAQSPSVKLKGRNLVGKADGFEVTQAQMDELRTNLMDRLNGDPELSGIAIDDIEYQVNKLKGSQKNIISSNVITSNVNNDEGLNIGIKLEPGAFENVLVNNLITNEKVQTPSQRGQFGKLDRGIVLLSSSNRILFNAIEFLDVGIVRGGGNERQDVKHLHLFKKLALVCDQSATGCPSGKDEKVIVAEIEEEAVAISASASVKFNRLALNFIEKNGIGIDVVDAESNLIDENLFLDNPNGGIVLSRLEPQGLWGVIDIRIEENDFVGGYSIVNLSTLPLDVSDNYQTDSVTVGTLKVPENNGPGLGGRYCESNFNGAKFSALGAELGLDFLAGFFGDSNDTNNDTLDDVLPPNTEFLPADVSLPPEKPRDCNPDVFPPQGPNSGSDPDPDSGSKVPQLVGAQGPPADLNRDGLFEDVNGNGRLDFDDAVTLARNISSAPVQAHREVFDFNGNGRADFDDAVKLALIVGGQAAAQALREMFGVVGLRVTNVINYSNGIRNTNFVVEGQGIASARVEIFNLRGMRVYDSGFMPGNRLTWRLEDERGAPLANGIYLYVVTVRGFNGEVLKVGVRRLVVLR